MRKQSGGHHVDIALYDVTNTLHLLNSGYKPTTPQLSQTLSASPQAAAIDRAASTAPQTHRTAGSHAKPSPAVGPAPDSGCSMPSTALLCLAWHRMRKRPPEELGEGGRSTRARRSWGWAVPIGFGAPPPARTWPLANQLRTFTVGAWRPAERLGWWWRVRKPRAGRRPASGRSPRRVAGAAPAAK